jgi:RimJ/RimL family protein N-acetyltransferase
LRTTRLDLDPQLRADADEMVAVLSDPSLYPFIGGRPPTLAELRLRYEQQLVGRSDDGAEEWHNWILRLRAEGAAVGFVQATIVDEGRRADIAWVVGVPWQGSGYASEAAVGLVVWLEGRGVEIITAHVHPDHVASGKVAERAGLSPTDEFEDGERVWSKQVRTDLDEDAAIELAVAEQHAMRDEKRAPRSP